MTGRAAALLRSRTGSWLGLGLLLLVFAGLALRWLREFRRGGLLDIDEAGYQSMAVMNFRGWESGGLGGWWDGFLAPGVHAPLMPGVTSPFYAVAGVGALVGLLVPLCFGVLCLAASFGLGRSISPAVGWGTVLLVAATPAVISYSRSYNFAIASAATVALTFWALARSRNFHGAGWSLLVGVFAGLAVLSRTLTLALMPGLALAAVVVVAVGPDRLRRTLHVLLAAVGSAVVAGPWYWQNGPAVWDYLTSFGYGARRAEYGSDESVLSATSWLRSLQYAVASLGLPVVALWGLGLLLLVLVALRRRPAAPAPASVATPLRWSRSLLMPSAVFLAWSALILTSTGNKGTGFLLPLVPPASLLVAAAVMASPRPVRAVVGALVAVVLVVNTASAADLDSPLADRRTVQVPVLGEAEVVDGRGEIQMYIGDGLRPPSTEVQPLGGSLVQRYPRGVRDVARRIDDLQPSVVMLGFRHRLLNPNSIQFAQLTTAGAPFSIGMVSPVETPDQAAMSAWLAPGGAAAGVCTLLLSPGLWLEIEPVVDSRALRQAAKDQGFRATGETWELPGPREIQVWQRC